MNLYKLLALLFVMNKSRFEEIVEKHDYEIFRRPKENSASLVFIAERHTPEIRQRNVKLLKDILSEEDLLLLENIPNPISYPDLQEQFFEHTGISGKTRDVIIKEMRNFQEEIANSPVQINDNASYLKQDFPCKIEGADDWFFYLAANIFLKLRNDVCDDVAKLLRLNRVNPIMHFFKKLSGRKVEEPVSDQEYFSWLGKRDWTDRLYFFTQHYRNLAFARTIKQKLSECKGLLYFVTGALHVISSSQAQFKGMNYLPDLSYGELTGLLRTTEPPIELYIIGPKE